jgi:hypothetical protein
LNQLDKIQVYLEIEKKLEKVSDIHSYNIHGFLLEKFNWISTIELLEQSSLLVTCDENDRSIEIIRPRNIFSNLNELISTSGRRITPPNIFHIKDISFTYPNEDEEKLNECTTLKNYFYACQLFSSFSDICDYEDKKGSDKKLIFVGSAMLTILPNYKLEDLLEISMPDSDHAVTKFFMEKEHRDQKKVILLDAIFSVFQEFTTLDFGLILRKLSEIFIVANKSYNLYMKEFSFEKIKSKFEHEKLEFTIKLNSIFSNIQNQILAVPLAMFLSSAQFNIENKFAFKNIVVWFAVIVFSLLLSFLIRNQKSTLTAIKAEIDQQQTDLADKYTEEKDYFSTVYTDLVTRYDTQNWLLLSVDIMVSIFILLTTIYFIVI